LIVFGLEVVSVPMTDVSGLNSLLVAKLNCVFESQSGLLAKAFLNYRSFLLNLSIFLRLPLLELEPLLFLFF
jgi:hypothetical protein